MRSAVRTAVTIASVALVFIGTYLLDTHRSLSYGYGALLLGSVVLAAWTVWARTDDAGATLDVPPWWLILFLLLCGVGLSGYVTHSAREFPTIPGWAQLMLWMASGLFLILAFHLWDRRRHPQPFPRLLDRTDWNWIVALAIAGCAIRIFNLAVEPEGLRYDEISPLADTLRLVGGHNLPAFWMIDQGFQGIFHYVNAFFITYLGWLGFDTVQTAKLSGAMFGGLSVATLYVMVRIVGTRPLAATAAVFLLWQGWHWILSRYYYLYAGDLLWIPLATAFLIAGLRSRRLSLIAAAGGTSALGMTWLNTAVMVAPWSVVVLAEHAITERGARWPRIAPACVWGLTFAVGIMPLAVELYRQPHAVERFTFEAQQRAEVLKREHLTSPQLYLRSLLGVLRVLQVQEVPRAREAVRSNRPDLDIILSAMATVGFVWCIFRFVGDRGARLCLLGFAIFLGPALGSSHGYEAVTRRMVGDSLFIAWMAAYGASVVSKRIAPTRLQPATMLLLASASLVLNAYYVRTVYNTEGLDEKGIERVYVVRALRQAARIGPVFFRPTFYTELARLAVADLPSVSVVQTPAELREGLMKHVGQMCVVVLPWPTTLDVNDSPEWIGQLADVIPPYYWEWGPPDSLGSPLYRIAKIRPAASLSHSAKAGS